MVEWLTVLFYLTAKEAIKRSQVSNQGAYGFKSYLRDLVMRIDTLPKSTSASTWFGLVTRRSKFRNQVDVLVPFGKALILVTWSLG